MFLMDIKKEGTNFWKINEIYDRARPSYPIWLINDIIQYSGNSIGIILDVGCGTGQVTHLFAERDCLVIGVDTDKDMIDIAKRKCLSFPKVDFKVEMFEDVTFPPESIDLIVSGMAWHWIKPDGIGEEKAHYFLKNNGTIALFWSHQLKEKSDFVKSVAKILDKYGEQNRGPTGSKVKEISNEIFERFKGNESFSSVEHREYEESIQYTKEKYRDLIVSYGWVQCLATVERRKLIKELENLFENYDEPLVIPHNYLLVLAKKH